MLSKKGVVDDSPMNILHNLCIQGNRLAKIENFQDQSKSFIDTSIKKEDLSEIYGQLRYGFEESRHC